ncbi:MAG: bacillithiol biosynthesis cysteine-adding enzyme BshC [Acidobacteria bacterium]|nr:bacillithiol biosynthesis cysteine-adding enzyme BshC [Acidobacteriota bacterium]
MMASPMECHWIRAAELPHTTRLYTSYLEDFGRLAEFYAHPPTAAGMDAAAREIKPDAAARRTLVEVLREQNRAFGADGATSRNLDRLAAGAVAVVTGQQVGLFTGPSYSIYKAVSALRFAAQMSACGTDAVPVFWVATEDHDLAEIDHCFWLGRGGLQRLEVAAAGAAGHRVGEVKLGEAVREAVRGAMSSLEGPAAEEIGRALEESYRPEESFGTAFGRLMARLFAGRGIILLNPLDARLHRLAAPVYRRALEESAALTGDLLVRSKKLERASYHAQVKVTERSTLLFLNVNAERLPLRRRGDRFLAGRAEFSQAELLDAIERRPEAFTANVLLRPVVQDALLPTAAYVGGPAEIAYFAQAEAVYRRVLGRMPAILPRAGFTLVEPRVARLLKKYGLKVRDVLAGRQRLRGKMEQEFVSKALARRFAEGEKAIRKVLGGLRKPLSKADKTLLGALDTAERKMLYQFLRLRGKAGRAENFRTRVLDTHERQLSDALYPHHTLQERTLCFLPLLASHGSALLEELAERSAIGATQHQVLFL